MTTTIDNAKDVAAGGSREAAIAVLVPRILGAIATSAYAVKRRKAPPFMTAEKGPFTVRLAPTDASVFFRVDWHNTLVMTGHVNLDGFGTHFGGRVSVDTWQRGPRFQEWQRELFDVFDEDSDELLNLPICDIPAVLATMLEVPVTEVEQIIWRGADQRVREVAAQLLWLELADSCSRAGRMAGINTTELGHVLIEFGIGLLALDKSPEELAIALRELSRTVASDGVSIVKAARAPSTGNPYFEARSWIRELSGLDAHAMFWASAQVRLLDRLRAFQPRKPSNPDRSDADLPGKRITVPRTMYPALKQPGSVR